MRRLTGGIPRAFPDGRRPEARQYAAHVRALVERFPRLPASARPLLQQSGLLAIDMARMTVDLNVQAARGRRREQARLRRSLAVARRQLMLIDRHLAALAESAP